MYMYFTRDGRRSQCPVNYQRINLTVGASKKSITEYKSTPGRKPKVVGEAEQITSLYALFLVLNEGQQQQQQYLLVKKKLQFALTSKQQRSPGGPVLARSSQTEERFNIAFTLMGERYLYHVTRFYLNMYLPFTVLYIYTEISSFKPVLSTRARIGRVRYCAAFRATGPEFDFQV